MASVIQPFSRPHYLIDVIADGVELEIRRRTPVAMSGSIRRGKIFYEEASSQLSSTTGASGAAGGLCPAFDLA
jgi:hypothetical protein